MKTTRTWLFATTITLAAVTFTSIDPSWGQRRSTGRYEAEQRPVKNKSARVESVNQKRSRPQQENDRQKSDARYTGKSLKRTGKSSSQVRTEKYSGDKSSGNRNVQNTYQRRQIREKSAPESARLNGTRADMHTYGKKHSGEVRRSNRTDRYNLHRNDRTYRPSAKHGKTPPLWTKNHRSENRKVYSHRGRNSRVNYSNMKHWDNHWEHYHWNHNSWIDYYRVYRPDSYCYHPAYFHHPRYGHVIRRFDRKPARFIRNNIAYYCYDGHFFRYRRGVGYVLIDLPYGIVFDVIPHGREWVHINGYAYLRIGNLFFEINSGRYQLVHYPERYYAYSNQYEPAGWQFEYSQW